MQYTNQRCLFSTKILGSPPFYSKISSYHVDPSIMVMLMSYLYMHLRLTTNSTEEPKATQMFIIVN